MAIELTDVRRNVQIFNEKYKVNYDLDDFMTRMRTENHDDLYEGTFNAMLDQAIEHMSELKNFDVATMIYDYNYHTLSFVNMYIRSHPDLDPPLQTVTLKRGTNNDTLASAYRHLDKKVWGKVDEVGQKYESREIRIRDMVREARDFANLQGELKEDAAKKIAGYALALRRVNESHPLWWRIIHPFRNNAEQREAGNFEKLLNTDASLKGDFEKYGEDFKQVDPAIYKIREQIQNRAKLYKIPGIKPEDDKKRKENDLAKEDKSKIKDVKKGELAQDADPEDLEDDEIESAAEKCRDMLDKRNGTLVEDIATEVKNAVKEFEKANIDAEVETKVYTFSEQISDSMIEVGVEALGEKALNICKQYDSFKSNKIGKEALDAAAKDNVHEMFHIMMEGLDGTQLPLKDKLVIVQKTIDKFLQKTTPAIDDPQTLGEFADNYLLKKDNEFLEDKFGKDTETREAINGACEALGIRVKIEGIKLGEGNVADVAQQIENAPEVIKDLGSSNVI